MAKKLLLSLVLALVLSLAVEVAAAAAAQPPTNGSEIYEYKAFPSNTQAGGHPDLTIRFKNGNRNQPFIPGSCMCNGIKDAIVETPTGFIGDPHSTPQCTTAQFSQDLCPADSQVGIAAPAVELTDGCSFYPEGECPSVPLPVPLYNLVPAPGQAGLLGFKAFILDFPVYTVFGPRTDSDYGLTATVKGITQFLSLFEFEQVLWGVPAAPIHDAQRYRKGGFIPMEPGQPSNSPERPFLSSPTNCSGGLTSTFRTVSYDLIEHSKTIPWPTPTGCDQLNFNPSLSAQPSSRDADSATGLDVSLKVPQNESPETPSGSELRSTTTTLPEGFSINPSAADGKTSCSNAESRFGTLEEAQCPEFSKVGTVSLLSSALPGPIQGGIYLGEPKPGERYRLVATADGYATHVKLLGTTRPDPRTGQLVVTFENLPQSPFTEFDMHFFGSERGLLATPEQCGTYAVNSVLAPWASELPNQTSTQFFSIDSGPGGSPCPGATRPFKPSFRAAGTSNGAGAYSPLSLYVSRPDGDQNLNTIGAKTPPGLAATLKGIPYCPQATLSAIANPLYSGVAEQISPKCPAASQVGVSSSGAGAGSRPYYAAGKVYLSGPYKGAPLSFTVVTPAVSGPYDLGNVVNRVPISIDPTTAAVTAVSDPLPQIIEGVPLRLRSVLLNLDRKNFTLNPTSCEPFEVTGAITGDQGAMVEPQSAFQVANCDTLDFEPKLTAKLAGPTRRGGNPALTATLTQDPKGAANIARAVVTLPHSEFLDQSHIRTVCTRVQFAADACPAASVYGRARAISPLLDKPVEGPVYLRSSSHELPDLVAALEGPAEQPIAIDLVGKIDSVGGGIRTTFAAVPDTPVSKFVLSMQGGKKGLLVNSRNLCKATNRATAKILGQNGASANQSPVLQAPCGSARKKRGLAR